jgi:hypothetical protein
MKVCLILPNFQAHTEDHLPHVAIKFDCISLELILDL